TLHVFFNRQAGDFRRAGMPGLSRAEALALADVDADARLDLITLDADGVVSRTWQGREGWRTAEWIRTGVASGSGPRVFVADVDNNGALDLVVSSSAGTHVWVADEAQRLLPLETPIAAHV